MASSSISSRRIPRRSVIILENCRQGAGGLSFVNSTVFDRKSTTAVLGVDFREAFATEAGRSQEYGAFIQINGQEVARIPERTRAFAHAQEGKYAHVECLSEAVLISTQSRRSKGRNAATAKNA